VGIVTSLILLTTLGADPAAPLWERRPFDRITLADGKTIEIDPVRIPAGTDLSAVKDDEYVGQPGLPPRAEIRRPVKYLIHDQTTGKEDQIYGRTVRKIDYFEDLCLAQAKREITAGRFDTSEKYLSAAGKLVPSWPGLNEAWVEHFYRQGSRLRLASQWGPSFASLLNANKKQASLEKPVELAPPVPELLDDVVTKWLNSFIAKGDYLSVRQTIGRVEQEYPDGASAPRIRRDLIAKSRGSFDAAMKNIAENRWEDARLELENALNINPTDEEIRKAVDALYQTHGHLRVGVEQSASFFGGPADWSTADHRAAELVHLTMMQREFVGTEFEWKSLVLSQVERPDEYLNKRAVIRLKEGLRWPKDGKNVSIIDVQRLLIESCRPNGSYFHPAFARLVIRMETSASGRITIDFERPQLRPEAWLVMPLIRLSDNNSGSGIGPFLLSERKSSSSVYLANPYFAVKERPVIKRVTEFQFPKGADRLAALAENRIDLATDLPPADWSKAGQIPGIRVATFELPTVYVLQFNFNQRVLRDRILRRAMACGIDHKRILSTLGLNGTDESIMTTAPWPPGMIGYDDTIKPRPHDVVLARTLVAAMVQKYSTLPTLRLVHFPSEVDRQACKEIAHDLEQIGLKISLVEFDPAAPVSPLTADLRYVPLNVRDPVYDTMTFLTRDNPSLGEHASPWLRQLLVDLVEVPNLSTAQQLLPKLHRLLYDDVAVIPLWQFKHRLAVSERVVGPATTPTSAYEKIIDWMIKPGYPPAGWTAEPTNAKAP